MTVLYATGAAHREPFGLDSASATATARRATRNTKAFATVILSSATRVLWVWVPRIPRCARN